MFPISKLIKIVEFWGMSTHTHTQTKYGLICQTKRAMMKILSKELSLGAGRQTTKLGGYLESIHTASESLDELLIKLSLCQGSWIFGSQSMGIKICRWDLWQNAVNNNNLTANGKARNLKVIMGISHVWACVNIRYYEWFIAYYVTRQNY